MSGFDFDAGDLAITSSSTIRGDANLTLLCIPSSGKLTRLSLRVFFDSALLIKVSLCFLLSLGCITEYSLAIRCWLRFTFIWVMCLKRSKFSKEALKFVDFFLERAESGMFCRKFL